MTHPLGKELRTDRPASGTSVNRARLLSAFKSFGPTIWGAICAASARSMMDSDR